VIKKSFSLLLFFFFALLIVSCGKKGIDTAEQLAEALKKQGVNYQVMEEVEHKLRFAKIDEAIALKGDSLWVEIFRIENLKGYNLAVQAVKMSVIVENQMVQEPEEKIEDAFFKHPFIVVVKQEPERGFIKQILINKIFPKTEE
jgi:hypothetical protein